MVFFLRAEHCVGHCVGCRSQAARRERKCGGPKLGTQGVASRGFSFQTLPAARSTARPTLEPGRAGWAKGRGTPRGQEGIPRALQEGDHSESNAKIQSRLGILPGGWGCGQPWGQEWVGPSGFLLPSPSRNLQGHREIQAGISMGSMTHPPLPPPTHTKGSKPPSSCQGLPERGSLQKWGLRLSPNSDNWCASLLSDTDEGP